MPETPAQRALGASTAALVIAFVAFAMLLPPLSNAFGSALRTTFVALALGAGLLLHWIFLAIGARRLGRSVAGWVALSIVLCPVGSVAALVLLTWLRAESDADDNAARAA